MRLKKLLVTGFGLTLTLMAFQNCSGFQSASNSSQTGFASIAKNQADQPLVGDSHPVAVLMNGAELCNSDNFAKVPGAPGYFLGRRMINQTSADPCSGTGWTLSEFKMDFSSYTMNWVNDLISWPIASPDGSFTITIGYDPTVIQYNGELWTAFECAGYGPTLSVMVSACVVPFTLASGADTSRLTIPVRGSANSTDQWSASVPKLLNFENNIYLYWSAVHADLAGNWKDITTRGMQLAQEPSGAKRIWALNSTGVPVPAFDPSNVEVLGLDPNNPTASSVADTFQVLPVGDMLYVTAGVGGSGCLSPLSPVFGCYHVQVSMAATPLGYHVFNQHPLTNSALPYNPQEYSHIYYDDAGGFYVLGNYLPANLKGQTPPSPIFGTGLQMFSVNLALYQFTGMPNGLVPIFGGASMPVPLGGLSLQAGQSVQLNAGLLIMQGDGNLVLYGKQTWQPLWNSGTAGADCSQGCQAVFQGDGNFVIYSGSTALWDTETSGTGARLFLSSTQPYLQINDENGKMLWANLPGYVQQNLLVTNLYQGLLGRAPDQGGDQGWLSETQSGQVTCAQLAVDFLNSNEFQTDNSSMSNTTFVTALYQGLLGRAPDSGGFAGWTADLNSRAENRQSTVDGFLQSTEFNDLCQSSFGFAAGAGAYSGLYIATP